MTVRKLMATVAMFGVAGSAMAQEPGTTPTAPEQTTPAQQTPAATQPVPTQSMPTTTSGGTVLPNGIVQGSYMTPMTYGYPQGQIIPSGYSATPMTYGYPQGQMVANGYTTPMTFTQPGVVTYGTPVMSGGTYGYPTTGYTSTGIYPTFGTRAVGTGAVYGSPTVVGGYPATSASNGGFIGTVVSTPTRAARRLFRR